MECMEDLKTYLEDFTKHTSRKNDKNAIVLENKEDNKIIATKEFLSTLFSEAILEDLQMIFMLYETGQTERYVDYIIRGMVDQIIEYKYIMQSQSLIDEFFASEVEIDEEIDDEISKEDTINGIKEIGGKRYAKKNVREMASCIGEDKNNDETKMTLYEIYMIFSDKTHNPYFKAITKYIAEYVSAGSKEDFIEEETMFMKFNISIIGFIVDSFLDTYDNI